MALYANATLSFPGLPGGRMEVKGFSVVRRGDPNFSAADLSSRITFVAIKNAVDILTCHVINPEILKLVQGATGDLTFTAKTADAGSDLVFTGQATCLGVEGEVSFADVESPCSATFAIVSSNGTTPDMIVA